MATTHFYLRDKKSKNPTAIYLSFRFQGKEVKYYIGESIKPKDWSFDKKKAKRTYLDSGDLNDYLDDVAAQAKKIYRNARLKKIPITAVYMKEELNRVFRLEEEEKNGFFDLFDKFIEVSKVTKSHRTIQKYHTLRKHLIDFQQKKRVNLSFDRITISFYEEYQAYYIQDLGFVNNTIAKYVASLKAFLGWAAEREYHHNYAFKKFKLIKQDADIVYMTEDELMRLYNMDLSENPRLNNVRDVFCFCCFTGLRFSDVQNLKPEDVFEERYIALRTIKTKDKLIIPLSDFALEILNLYKDEPGFLPVYSSQKTNDFIKELCELAGIDEMMTLVRYRGVARVEASKPKYAFISTHTARRTFVTLSLEKGMRPETVMAITGHKSYKTFKKYIKLTDKVKAEEMGKVWGRMI